MSHPLTLALLYTELGIDFSNFVDTHIHLFESPADTLLWKYVELFISRLSGGGVRVYIFLYIKCVHYSIILLLLT